MSSPRVTVALPVYNGERYLAAALRSVREQTFTDIEIVVSDNASTDGTAEIVAAAAVADPRIRSVRQEENRGGLWNWNHLVGLARGELFTYAAADDLMRPEYLAECVALLDREGPEVVLAYPRTQIIDADGTITEDLNDGDLRGQGATPHARLREFLRAQAAHLVYGVYRTDVLRSTRRLVPVVGNDLVLVAEMACRGRFGLVPRQLFLQRRHPAQFSRRRSAQTQFHAPGQDPRFMFAHSRVTWELWKAVLTSPIGVSEKVRCLATVVAAWTLPRWRGPAADLRLAVTGR